MVEAVLTSPVFAFVVLPFMIFCTCICDVTPDGDGATGKVKMVFTIIKRQDLLQVINIIKQFNLSAFYSVEVVKSVAEKGVFPLRKSHGVFSWMEFLRFYRKGKLLLPVHENESQMKFDPAV